MNLNDTLDNLLITLDNRYLCHKNRLTRKYGKLTCELCGSREWRTTPYRASRNVLACRHCGAVFYLNINRVFLHVLTRIRYITVEKG